MPLPLCGCGCSSRCGSSLCRCLPAGSCSLLRRCKIRRRCCHPSGWCSGISRNDGAARLDLSPEELGIVTLADSALGYEVQNMPPLPFASPGYQFWTVLYLTSASFSTIISTTLRRGGWAFVSHWSCASFQVARVGPSSATRACARTGRCPLH